MNTSDPFDLLLDLEQRCQKHAQALPLDRAEDEWVGIGLRIGDTRLMAAMAEIEEIIELPEYTTVPGMRSWIVGVANVRGSLLPLIDIKGYITGEDLKRRKQARVIVVSYKGFSTGLLVEEVYGMRYFSLKNVTTEISDVDELVAKYVERAFRQEEEYWPVFSFEKLAQEERFLQASL